MCRRAQQDRPFPEQAPERTFFFFGLANSAISSAVKYSERAPGALSRAVFAALSAARRPAPSKHDAITCYIFAYSILATVHEVDSEQTDSKPTLALHLLCDPPAKSCTVAVHHFLPYLSTLQA